ncbi:MAG: hypothetical protein GKR93_11285 [Gammaproteobacteria bacterium]|nr:hypothetical protein [Gammaproteobacteria bacterium]
MLSKLIKTKFFQFHFILASCFIFSSLSAHHSAAMFDLNSEMTLAGKVTKYQFSNPHVWVHFEVVDDKGEAKIWKIEALNPNALKRKGWKRSSFKPGDEVTITFYPAKSGLPKGGFIRAITADGTRLGRPLPDASNKDEFHDDL